MTYKKCEVNWYILNTLSIIRREGKFVKLYFQGLAEHIGRACCQNPFAACPFMITGICTVVLLYLNQLIYRFFPAF